MASAAAKKVLFPKDSKFKAWLRYFNWNYNWEGRQYGLMWNDCAFWVLPEVKEAVRRLPPHEYDARQMRLVRAHLLAMRNEVLPKDQWTKWEEETWYLEPFLQEIEKEKAERSTSTGIEPYWQMKYDYQRLDH